MSWLYSQALVEEYSEDTSLDGEPCALWSGKHTQQASWLPAKTTKCCQLSQSGMTFKPLTDDLGEGVLTSYLEAFPVKTSPVQEKAKASKENDHPCGNTWRELCLKCSPDTSSLKTVRCLWEEDLPLSSVTLPKWGIMLNGELWERTTLPHLTSGTGSGSSGSWPTPCTRDYKGANAEDGLIRNDGKSRMDQLPNAVKYITPRVGGEESLSSVEKRKGREAAEGHNTFASVEAAHGEQRGQLSPNWVEWLMGWPIGWTSMEEITELDWRDWSVDPANEGEVPRVATGIKHRVGRLKAIGNGQVPQVAAMAWKVLTK